MKTPYGKKKKKFIWLVNRYKDEHVFNKLQLIQSEKRAETKPTEINKLQSLESMVVLKRFNFC